MTSQNLCIFSIGGPLTFTNIFVPQLVESRDVEPINKATCILLLLLLWHKSSQQNQLEK